MSARKPTKSELAARRKRKESAARRSGEPLKPIDIWAAQIVECYEALVRAGYGACATKVGAGAYRFMTA